MNELLFEWDQNKNILNQKKHNISFEEARTVFLDDNALLIDDPDHSQEEDRFILLGFSLRAKLLVVCHCYRRSENVIRLISARKATKSESSAYTNNREWGDWDERRIWFQQRNKKSLRKKNKKQITINIDSDTIDYFKKLSANSGIPYQTLINLYLSDCATHNRTLTVSWT